MINIKQSSKNFMENIDSLEMQKLLVKYFDTKVSRVYHYQEARILAKVGDVLMVIDPYARPSVIGDTLKQSVGDIVYVGLNSYDTTVGKYVTSRTFSSLGDFVSYLSKEMELYDNLISDRNLMLYNEECLLKQPVDEGDVVAGSPEVVLEHQVPP